MLTIICTDWSKCRFEIYVLDPVNVYRQPVKWYICNRKDLCFLCFVQTRPNIIEFDNPRKPVLLAVIFVIRAKTKSNNLELETKNNPEWCARIRVAFVFAQLAQKCPKILLQTYLDYTYSNIFVKAIYSLYLWGEYFISHTAR